MRPHAVGEVEFTPLFNWSPVRRRKLSLFSFIAASVALHALCFYLFQIIYPPTVALLPPPARVNLITANSEEGRLLLRWIEAEDPALSSMTQRPPDSVVSAVPDVNHVPSYTNWRPALREPPPMQPDLRIPSAQPPGPVPTRRQTQPQPAPTTQSTIEFAEAESLGTPATPPLKFSASRRESPQSAEFRVAISHDGTVRHSFLERSSGDAALDEQARHAIALTRFPPREIDVPGLKDGLVWTTAAIEWGNDIALPPDPATATTTP